jgi:hypothetical protein
MYLAALKHSHHISTHEFVPCDNVILCQRNDKPAILEALISSNNKVWGEFNMHPLKTNMRLATAAAAQARGGLLSQEEEEQLRYAGMLIDGSNNCNSPWCQVMLCSHYGVTNV